MKKLIFSLILVFFAASSYARECRDTDTAYIYAKRTAYKVAHHYDGTKNVRVNMASCDFDPYDEYYTINMYTYWNGSISGDTYNVDGILKVSLNGSVISFKETYKNQNVKDWVGSKTVLSVIGALLENSSSYSE